MYFFTSSDFDDEGPYWSLEAALQNEHFATVTSQPGLYSDVIPLAHLMELALNLVDDGDEIVINHQRFQRASDRLDPI